MGFDLKSLPALVLLFSLANRLQVKRAKERSRKQNANSTAVTVRHANREVGIKPAAKQRQTKPTAVSRGWWPAPLPSFIPYATSHLPRSQP
jgi:hypothetical protein